MKNFTKNVTNEYYVAPLFYMISYSPYLADSRRHACPSMIFTFHQSVSEKIIK